VDPPVEAVATSSVKANVRAEDQRLVAAILQKDRNATAEFVARYADQIYLYVRSRLIPRMDLVDDPAQDVLLRHRRWRYELPSRRRQSRDSWPGRESCFAKNGTNGKMIQIPEGKRN